LFPYNYSVNLNKNIGPFGLNVGINTLGMLGIDDPRTPEDESEQPDYGINAGYNTDVFGGNLSLGAGYNPMSGANLGLSFSKQFNQGGRVSFEDGTDPKKPKGLGSLSKRNFLKTLALIPAGIMAIRGGPNLLKKAKPAVEAIKNAPPHFMGLVNKIRALGKVVDLKQLMPSDQKIYSNVYDYGEYRMFEKPDGGIEISKEKLMDTEYGDAKVSEEYMSYNPKVPKYNKKGEIIPDEFESQYDEYTAYADQDGKMKDVVDGVDPNTIDDGTYSKEELEQLIIEQVEQNLKKGKK